MRKIYRRLIRTVCFVLCLMIGWPLVITGQEEPKIRLAIIDFSTTSQEPEHAQLEKIVPEWLTTFFVKTQMFDVIERRQLEVILQEQTLSQTGLLDEQSAAKVGQVLGVDMLVTGTIISVADTLEVTARVVNAETGTILGVASVIADDVEELRDEIEVLGKALSNALRKESVPESITTVDDETLDSDQWDMIFAEDFPEKDKANTHWSWSEDDGLFSLNGTYTGKDSDRVVWITPRAGEAYTTIELTFRVKEFAGAVSVCAESGWAEDTMWSGICSYIDEDGVYITISIESGDDVEAEEEFDFDLDAGKGHTIRQEYQDGEFQYYYNDRLLTTLAPDAPVDDPDDLWAEVGVYLEETQNVLIEFDDISVR